MVSSKINNCGQKDPGWYLIMSFSLDTKERVQFKDNLDLWLMSVSHRRQSYLNTPKILIIPGWNPEYSNKCTEAQQEVWITFKKRGGVCYPLITQLRMTQVSAGV